MKPQMDLDFSRYPNTPGFKRSGTSEAAAKSMAKKAPRLRDRVMQVLRQMKCTADEVAEILQASPFSIRPRLAELHELRMIRDSGTRRVNGSGKMAVVWEKT